MLYDNNYKKYGKFIMKNRMGENFSRKLKNLRNLDFENSFTDSYKLSLDQCLIELNENVGDFLDNFQNNSRNFLLNFNSNIY